MVGESTFIRWLLWASGLMLLAGGITYSQVALPVGSSGLAQPDDGFAWQRCDYTPQFRPLMERYGSVPIRRSDFCRFGTAKDFDRYDTNHNGVLEEQEFQRAFLTTRDHLVKPSGRYTHQSWDSAEYQKGLR
jgi:hypothetical protein